MMKAKKSKRGSSSIKYMVDDDHSHSSGSKASSPTNFRHHTHHSNTSSLIDLNDVSLISSATFDQSMSINQSPANNRRPPLGGKPKKEKKKSGMTASGGGSRGKTLGDAFITGLSHSPSAEEGVWNRHASPLPEMSTRVPTPSTSRSHLHSAINRSVLPPSHQTIASQLSLNGKKHIKKSNISTLTTHENHEKLAKYLPVLENQKGLKQSMRRHKSSATLNSQTDQMVAQYSHKLPALKEACSNLTGTLRELNSIMVNQSNDRDVSSFQKQLDALQPEKHETKYTSTLEKVQQRMRKVGKDELVPHFVDEKDIAQEPRKGYAAMKIYEMKTNPDSWREFTEVVSTWKRKKDHHDEDIIARNVDSVMSNHPSVQRDRKKEKLEEKKAHGKQVQEQHELRVAQVVDSIKSSDQRRTERHAAQAFSFVTFVAFGARTNVFLKILQAREDAREQQNRLQAAVVIQRFYARYCRGAKTMSTAKAFAIKAKFMLRYMTKIRATKIRDMYVDRMANLITKIDFNTRILFGFRHFHSRVVRAQRLIRARKQAIELERRLRRMQWDKAVLTRHDDLAMLVKKLEGESLQLRRETPQLLAARGELFVLDHMEEERTFGILEEYRAESRAAFADAEKSYHVALEQWHKIPFRQRPALPNPPHRKILVPQEQLDVLIKAACRTMISEGKAEEAMKPKMAHRSPSPQPSPRPPDSSAVTPTAAATPKQGKKSFKSKK